MATDQWQLILAAMVAVHALLVYHVYLLQKKTTALSSDTNDTDMESVGAADVTVTCSDCGTENEAGYRYCRSCVSELPGAMGVEYIDINPVSGFTG